MKTFALFLMALLLGQPALAQDTDLTGQLLIELNSAQPADGSCTLSFMVTNGLDQQIDEAIYEMVLFDTDGRVSLLTLFNFGQLPQARPRVRQFAVPGLDCAGLGKVLFNGATSCKGQALDEGVCVSALRVETRENAIEVLG